MESRSLDPSDLDRLRRLVEARPDIVAAWLFGSRARGAGRVDSDIDVAVWFDTSAGSATLLDRRLDLAVACASALGVPIERLDLIAVNEAGPLLLHAVLHDGVLLKDADPAARVALQVDALNRYVEASYLRDEALRARAQRLGRRS
jgi:predicted nucleotidyltransferase